ncbi:hypothetical protein [Flammeovirga aprica]|uniref:Uncharacterized protein n=1 Tax=Flammeovirga aprica JL-4 TaxID=694437 RepID=A0A7X9RY22_9BACT|nr:hypothetical protein [Flammeovirga aprica]NME70877.1 hypothetical protein [Flammeovirga aprica JL-4]
MKLSNFLMFLISLLVVLGSCTKEEERQEAVSPYSISDLYIKSASLFNDGNDSYRYEMQIDSLNENISIALPLLKYENDLEDIGIQLTTNSDTDVYTTDGDYLGNVDVKLFSSDINSDTMSIVLKHRDDENLSRVVQITIRKGMNDEGKIYGISFINDKNPELIESEMDSVITDSTKVYFVNSILKGKSFVPDFHTSRFASVFIDGEVYTEGETLDLFSERKVKIISEDQSDSTSFTLQIQPYLEHFELVTDTVRAANMEYLKFLIKSNYPGRKYFDVKLSDNKGVTIESELLAKPGATTASIYFSTEDFMKFDGNGTLNLQVEDGKNGEFTLTSDIFSIYTVEDLKNISLISGDFILKNDIEVNEEFDDLELNGSLDGNNKTITSDIKGELFARARIKFIKNLNLKNINNNTEEDFVFVSVTYGKEDAYFENIKISSTGSAFFTYQAHDISRVSDISLENARFVGTFKNDPYLIENIDFTYQKSYKISSFFSIYDDHKTTINNVSVTINEGDSLVMSSLFGRIVNDEISNVNIKGKITITNFLISGYNQTYGAKISNITVSELGSHGDFISLFYNIGNSVIDNIEIGKISTDRRTYYGLFANEIENSSISNIYLNVTNIGTESRDWWQLYWKSNIINKINNVSIDKFEIEVSLPEFHSNFVETSSGNSELKRVAFHGTVAKSYFLRLIEDANSDVKLSDSYMAFDVGLYSALKARGTVCLIQNVFVNADVRHCFTTGSYTHVGDYNYYTSLINNVSDENSGSLDGGQNYTTLSALPVANRPDGVSGFESLAESDLKKATSSWIPFSGYDPAIWDFGTSEDYPKLR